MIDDHTAIEVKAKKNISQQDIKPLLALAEEKKFKRYLCVSLETKTRRVGPVTILPYSAFLDALWEREYS